MFKRWISFSLMTVLLLTCMLPAGALSKEERYMAAVDELAAYVSSEREEVDLNNLVDNFAMLGNYEFSQSFLHYTKILSDIELYLSADSKQESDDEYNAIVYIPIYFTILRKDSAFEEYLSRDERFGSVDDMENYFAAKKAEKEGNLAEAYDHYQKANSFMDSISRIAALTVSLAAEKYTLAMEYYASEKYEEAYDILKELEENGLRFDLLMEMVIAQLPKEHKWIPATCTENEKCADCGETGREPLGHNYAPATCSAPETCLRCGHKNGSGLGHDYSEATCIEPAVCRRCGAVSGSMKGHQYRQATCTEPALCKVCGHTGSSKLGHDYTEATCTKPAACTRCGQVSGSKLMHDYTQATCTKPATCKICGYEEGGKLNHQYTEATCRLPAACIYCGVTRGTTAGHRWMPATYTQPQTCSVCGATKGTVLHRSIKECGRLVASVSDYRRGNNPEASAKSLIDGSNVNSWDSNGKNIGEYFILASADGREYEVRGLEIVNGKHDSKYFARNCRIKTLSVYVDGVYFGRIRVADIRNETQYIAFGPVVGSEFKFVIDDIYEGTHYKDVCVAEANLY